MRLQLYRDIRLLAGTSLQGAWLQAVKTAGAAIAGLKCFGVGEGLFEVVSTMRNLH